MHGSVREMWFDYLQSIGDDPESTILTFRVGCFGDNQEDADELATLARDGVKRATASSVWEWEGERLPKVGDLDVVTFWSGEACCIVATTGVKILPFRDVPPEFAAREGEGDGSLAYWRRVHWDYYERVLRPLGKVPGEDLPVMCQEFELVHPITHRAPGAADGREAAPRDMKRR